MAPVHCRSSPSPPNGSPPSPKSLLATVQIPASSRPASLPLCQTLSSSLAPGRGGFSSSAPSSPYCPCPAVSNLGDLYASPTPPSFLSDFVRLKFQAELPDSVDIDGVPQDVLVASIQCSGSLDSEGFGSGLASSGDIPVGSLPDIPNPSVAGGLEAGASPLASSSPPQWCTPCPSSGMPAVSLRSTSSPSAPSSEVGPLPAEVAPPSAVSFSPSGTKSLLGQPPLDVPSKLYALSSPSWAAIVSKDANLEGTQLRYFHPPTPSGSIVEIFSSAEVIQQGEASWKDTPVGYFYDFPLNFYVVNHIARKIWAKFGITHVAEMDSGFFLFRFANESRMLDCLNYGP